MTNKTVMTNNQNTKLFIQENGSVYIVCDMAAILSRGDELIETLDSLWTTAAFQCIGNMELSCNKVKPKVSKSEANSNH